MCSIVIDTDKDRLKKLEDFFSSSDYKSYVSNAISYNRKLNEDRRMRLPYIDGQTGVAQRHYDCAREKRQRMPPRQNTAPLGQILSYPRKPWRKQKYQYLKFLLHPKRVGLTEGAFPSADDDELMMHTISQIENPSHNEESNQSAGKEETKQDWSYYEEEMFEDEKEEKVANSDSDFEYDDYSNKKRKGKAKGRGKGSKSGSSAKKRSFGDSVSDAEKSFNSDRGRSSRRSSQQVSYRESDMTSNANNQVSSSESNGSLNAKITKTMSGKERATSLGYCDFCLGDSTENKKTSRPELLVSCAECGRCGHPSCLQFSDNMIVSVREYAWQCIECKCCTLCTTSDNDDQLLFCDDCDRGYHMYCLVPPIKEPPEGSWSCKLCMQRFHRKK